MDAVTYEPYMGPSSNPIVVKHAHIKTIHTRCFILNISSTLPETMTDGTADATPETNRPTIAPETDGVTATITHAIQ